MLVIVEAGVATWGFITQFSSFFFLHMFENFHNKKILKNHAFDEYLINWKMLSAKDIVQNYTYNKSQCQRNDPRMFMAVFSGRDRGLLFFSFSFELFCIFPNSHNGHKLFV